MVEQTLRDLPPAFEFGPSAFVVETVCQQALIVAERNHIQRARFDRCVRK